MDANSGIFTVQQPGIYHFSFSGLFYALNGHGINAYITRQRGNVVKYLGRSKADTDERGIGKFFRDDLKVFFCFDSVKNRFEKPKLYEKDGSAVNENTILNKF